MTKTDVFEKLKEIMVREFELDASAVTPEAKLFDTLELDSIDAVDLIVNMKPYMQAQDKKLDVGMFKQATTVQNVVDIIYPLVSST
jgi:acyl carrier protein